MIGHILAWQFAFCERAVGINLEGVTPEQSLLCPATGGNSINWVLGHLVVYRHEVLALLGEPREWPAAAAYKRGTGGDVAVQALLPLPRLLDDFRATTPRVVERLEGMSDADLSAMMPSGKQTVGERLAFDVFHESYHVGQIGLLRRHLGLPGAIR